MRSNRKNQALNLYLVLAALFIASLVACNLIFLKFFKWQPISGWDYTFEQSVGLLAYPFTFLVTDVISELYGRKRANAVVMAGLAASVFVLLLIWLADSVQATSWSAVDDSLFHTVFGSTSISVGASMAAYLIAQFIDVHIFHFWKRKTKGKHLWLRNNFSTIPSQIVDTAVVLGLLVWGGKIAGADFQRLFVNGFLFKVIFAFLDTPILYLLVFAGRRYFGLKRNEEIKLTK